MTQMITVFGYGPVGKAVCARLLLKGYQVQIVQRRAPTELPTGATFLACDILDHSGVSRAIEGATQVVLATGLAYSSKIWSHAWPKAMTNVLNGCASHRARLVFVDNLYMYGPQTTPLTETMALTNMGGKPGARAEVTRLWMAAANANRVKVTALRASDFYGPGVASSQLGSQAIGAIGEGKKAMLLLLPDVMHDFVYVDDFARAVESLLLADDDCFGHAWHVPTAPTLTPRAILQMAADRLEKRLVISALSPSLLPVLGLVVPMLKEMSEMRFQFDRPYLVDSSKFQKRFWNDPTSFNSGIFTTAFALPKPLAIAA
jgi:nucleoside-diphosphate-sugar epimerase